MPHTSTESASARMRLRIHALHHNDSYRHRGGLGPHAAAQRMDSYPTLDPGPVPRPAKWLDHVNPPQTPAELDALRECLQRRRPFGDCLWMGKTAHRLGLQSSLRPRGRPRKQRQDEK